MNNYCDSLNYKRKAYSWLIFYYFKRHALNKAFNYWATHADISFKEVCDKCEADFVIEFGEGNHGDGYPFDGQSNFKLRFTIIINRSNYNNMQQQKI